jgi:RNA polymerase-binding transcription factor DksA
MSGSSSTTKISARTARKLLQQAEKDIRRELSRTPLPETLVDDIALPPAARRYVRRMEQLREAMARVEQETFGRCLSCDRLIELDRLKENPLTTACRPCAHGRAL